MFHDLVHQIWKNHLPLGGRAIDATCGNGHDAQFLTSLSLAHLFIFDIQEIALKKAQKRLKESKNVSYHLECHSIFSPIKTPVNLIVYNLGYLPGGNKDITTEVNTTLKSIKKGLTLLDAHGLISCMLYPGHPEGLKEKTAVLEYAESLSSENFQVSHHQKPKSPKAPSLLLIKKNH